MVVQTLDTNRSPQSQNSQHDSAPTVLGGYTRHLVSQQSGASSAEYALILAGLAGLLLASAMLLGYGLKGSFSGASDSLGGGLTFRGQNARNTSIGTTANSSRSWPAAATDHAGAFFQQLSRTQYHGLALLIGIAGITILLLRRKMKKPIEEEEEPVERKLDDPKSRLHRRRQDILLTLQNHSGLVVRSELQVQHMMDRDIETLSPKATRAEMIALMNKQQTSSVIIVDSHQRPLGFVGKRDLLSETQHTARQLVREFPCVTKPDVAISQVISALLSHNVSFMPVVENKTLQGLITSDDMMLALQCSLQLFLRLSQFADIQQQRAIAQHDSLPDATLSEQLRKFADRTSKFEELDQSHADSNLAEKLRDLAYEGKALAEEVEKSEVRLREKYDLMLSAFEVGVDPVSGLKNRRALIASIEEQLALQQRHEYEFSLLIVVTRSSERGSDADDRIRDLADFITQRQRATDIPSQWNENTLVSLLSHCVLDQAVAFAARFREKAAIAIASQELVLSVVSGKSAESAEEIVKRIEEVCSSLDERDGDQITVHDGNELHISCILA